MPDDPDDEGDDPFNEFEPVGGDDDPFEDLDVPAEDSGEAADWPDPTDRTDRPADSQDGADPAADPFDAFAEPRGAEGGPASESPAEGAPDDTGPAGGPGNSADDPFAGFDADVPGEDPFDAFREVEIDDDEDPIAAAIDPDAGRDDDRTYSRVSKHRFCEQCEYFTDPPEVGCTHETAEIVEFVDWETVLLVDCPVVAERRALGNVDGLGLPGEPPDSRQ
jgi:hypothetical protein